MWLQLSTLFKDKYPKEKLYSFSFVRVKNKNISWFSYFVNFLSIFVQEMSNFTIEQ
jgi:hypothetical protein